ncbi:MAG TPA: dTMP kinase [Bacillota bacterium]|nr:dTMP kinase [Bacillota bacterium]HPE38117.1 dTMP kinase [Bacillota bacterium]
MNERKGLFITFEGIDGCGKTTQLTSLSQMLQSKGYEVLLIREPGGTSIGEKIRSILLDKNNLDMTPITELLLYEAARAQITQEKIRPWLERGNCVICDRFYDSTVAYQGYGRGLSLSDIHELNELSTNSLAPDITFLLDISPEEAYARREGRGGEEDRLEGEGLAFMKKVREGYLTLAKDNARIKVIHAASSVDTIRNEIEREVWEVLES